eukprot:403046_1
MSNSIKSPSLCSKFRLWMSETGSIVRERASKIQRYSINYPDDFDPSFSGVTNYLADSAKYYRENPAALRREILSGFTVGVVLIPESIAFSFLAGVTPTSGLYATVIMAFITSLIGGGPGIISGA